MNGCNYAGEFHIELEKRENVTVISKKYFNGLVKVSPTIHLDKEKVSTYFILGLGGGYVEGEKYRNSVYLKEDARAIVTTQAATKVYKCLKGYKTEQETDIKLEKGSVLEYIMDSVILYRYAEYKQKNNIYLTSSSTLIYSDAITSGWSPEGNKFQYNNLQLSTKIYVDDRLVLLDNLLINPKEDDVTALGYFEGYENLGTLIVIDYRISKEVIDLLRMKLNKLELPISYGISLLEENGFVLRVLGNLTQNIECAINVCHNYIRKMLLNSGELVIRKY